jgi:hypothetical protein
VVLEEKVLEVRGVPEVQEVLEVSNSKPVEALEPLAF